MKLLIATMVVFLFSFSAKADLVITENGVTQMYQHTLFDPEIGITLSEVITPEKDFDFQNYSQDIAPYIHTVKDLLTGRIYPGGGNGISKIPEPSTWLLIIAGVFLITIFVITRRN